MKRFASSGKSLHEVHCEQTHSGFQRPITEKHPVCESVDGRSCKPPALEILAYNKTVKPVQGHPSHALPLQICAELTYLDLFMINIPQMPIHEGVFKTISNQRMTSGDVKWIHS